MNRGEGGCTVPVVNGPMMHRRGNRFTIRKAMEFVALAGGILGLLAVIRNEPDVIVVVGLLSLVIIIPAHFAIEGNRRDAI